MKAKKTLISLSVLILSPLFFTACSGDGQSPRTGDVVAPQPGGVPLPEPSVFFSALKKSEQELQSKYGFISSLDANSQNIEYTDHKKPYLGWSSYFEFIANRNRQSLVDTKIHFYSDIYAFAQNYELLKLREQELKEHSPGDYKTYSTKTLELGRIFVERRAKFISRLFERSEEQLNRLGFTDFEVISRGVLDISVVGVDYSKFNRQNRQQVINTIIRSQHACGALTSMLVDSTFKDVVDRAQLPRCSSSPVVATLSRLTNVQNLSKEQIANFVDRNSVIQLESLNMIADQYLNQNSVVLKARNESGISDNIRREWENEVIRQNPGTRIRVLNIALENNLFENILFKRRVLQNLVDLASNVDSEKAALYRKERRALRKAIKFIQYREIDFTVGTSAITNGLNIDSKVQRVNPMEEPEVIPEAVPDTRPKSRPESEVPPEEPRKVDPPAQPKPRVEERDNAPAAPPKPPTSIRRRP